jgi:hypothetical protein
LLAAIIAASTDHQCWRIKEGDMINTNASPVYVPLVSEGGMPASESGRLAHYAAWLVDRTYMREGRTLVPFLERMKMISDSMSMVKGQVPLRPIADWLGILMLNEKFTAEQEELLLQYYTEADVSLHMERAMAIARTMNFRINDCATANALRKHFIDPAAERGDPQVVTYTAGEHLFFGALWLIMIALAIVGIRAMF